MTARRRIDDDPTDPLVPYSHLLPLVEALVAHGNRITLPGSRGELFAPSQGGYVAYLAEPIDWPWVQSTFELPDLLRYDADRDELFDHKNWVSILGSQG